MVRSLFFLEWQRLRCVVVGSTPYALSVIFLLSDLEFAFRSLSERPGQLRGSTCG